MRRSLLPLLALALLTGCASFSEEHYFYTKDSVGTPVNFFRVRVTGNTGLSRMRYVSGYYDERAVDLYFNEVKNAPDAAAGAEIAPLFINNQKNPGTTDNLTPFNPPPEHGTLLMIFSSNPNSVAATIGQFAESQQNADAITNLLNHREVKELRSQTGTQTSTTLKFTTAATQITSILANLPQDAATATVAAHKSQSQATALSLLRALAVNLGGDGNFATFAEARTWFAAQRAARSTP
jgi:hypothetical protein